MCVQVCVRVRACGCKRERERERERDQHPLVKGLLEDADVDVHVVCEVASRLEVAHHATANVVLAVPFSSMQRHRRHKAHAQGTCKGRAGYKQNGS